MKRVVPTFVALMALTMGTAWANDEEKRRVLKLDDVGVETQSEFYRQKAREKRHESIKFLTDLLRNNPPRGEQKAEMLLRLADLYFEEGRDVYLTEMDTFGPSSTTASTPQGATRRTWPPTMPAPWSTRTSRSVSTRTS